MATPNRANMFSDVGVNRDANADTNVNVVSAGLVTDIGVNATHDDPNNFRDNASMPNAKTRAHQDGPVPFNPKTGNTNKYQR